MLVLGPVGDQDQQARALKAVHQVVEQRLGLLVDALEILHHEDHRLAPALGQQHVAHRVLDAPAALRRIERTPRLVLGLEIGEREQGRERRGERAIERQDLAGDLLADDPLLVEPVDLAVAAQGVHHRHPGRRLPVGDRPAFQQDRPVHPRPLDELADDARLADAGLAHQRHQAPLACAAPRERLAQPLHLGLAAHEARQAAHRRRLQAVARRARPGQLVHLDRVGDPFDRHRSEGRHGQEALGEPPRLRGEQRRAGPREALHLGRQVGGLADRAVVHVQIAADGAHHDLAGVEPDADLHVHALRAAQVAGQPVHLLVHPQRGVGGAHRVILVGHRRAEDGHDPVAEHLVHGALVAVDGLHHHGQHRIEHAPRVLGIAIGQELERALHVGEEHRHLLALALERAARGADLLGQVRRRVGLGRGEADRARDEDRLAAAPAEARARLVHEAAARARSLEGLAARDAEAMARRVLGAAAGTGHRPRLGRRGHAATRAARAPGARRARRATARAGRARGA